MNQVNKVEKKRFQNKISQRNHRLRQQERLKELEAQVSTLKEKLENCINRDKSMAELKTVYDGVVVRMENLRYVAGELQSFLEENLFDCFVTDPKPTSVLSSKDKKDLEDDVQDVAEPVILTHGPEEIIDDVSRLPSLSSLTAFSSPTSIDLNETLKCYLYNNNLSLKGHLYNSEAVLNNISSYVITTINDTKVGDSFELVKSPKIMNLVCSAANEIFEKIPRLQNYTFALGGVQWLCGQALLLCLTNPSYENVIDKVLFNQNCTNYKQLYSSIQQTLNVWDNPNDFNKKIDLITKVSGTVNDEMKGLYPLLHQFFHPTNLQAYLIKHNPLKYPHWINFVIWPEYRDAILTNWESIEPSSRDYLLNDLIDNVVLVIHDETSDKLFHMTELSTVVNYTLDCLSMSGAYDDELTISPTIERLRSNGLFNPKNWRVTRSYGLKFKNIIPDHLVIWDIDDTIPENFKKPFYSPLL